MDPFSLTMMCPKCGYCVVIYSLDLMSRVLRKFEDADIKCDNCKHLKEFLDDGVLPVSDRPGS